MDNFLSFCRVKLVDLLEQLEGFHLAIRILLRVDLLGWLKISIRKVPLRFSAGLSARPMVAPVDFRHLYLSSRKLVRNAYDDIVTTTKSATW